MKTNEVFESKYLSAPDLGGKTVRVTIDDVTMEKIGDDRKAVLHLVGKKKAMVLNRTNWTRLEEQCGSDDSDDWRGWSIVLYPTKVDFQGKRVDAIRIDDRPGSSKPPARAARQSAPPPPPAEFVEDVEDEPHHGTAITEDDIQF